MSDRKTELLKLKDHIYEIHKATTTDDEFNNLLINKNSDPELLQSIILLHNSYKADMQNLKSFNLRSMNGIIDNVITGDLEHEARIKALEEKAKHLEEKSKHTKWEKIFVGVIIVLFILFSLFSLNKDAAQAAVDGLKGVKDAVIGIDSSTNGSQ